MLKPLLMVVAQTSLIYLLLMALLRTLGRRMLSQLNTLDLVVLVTLGSAVETSMVAGNTSLVAGIASASTLFALNWMFNRGCRKSRRFRHLVDGGPILLVSFGKVQYGGLHKCNLTLDDLMEACREREVAALDQVKFAVREPDGAIHIVRMDVGHLKADGQKLKAEQVRNGKV